MHPTLSAAERHVLKANWKMPPANLGPCVWRPDTSSEPVAAIVTQVGSRSVMLSILSPDNRGLMPMDGVRHIEDPELGDHAGYTGGCWDYTDEAKELAALRSELAELKALVAN